MDDALYGTRDKRGDWKPKGRLAYPPLFVWSPRPLALLKWLFGYPGYILPWNLFYGVIGVVFWLCLTPPMESPTRRPGRDRRRRRAGDGTARPSHSHLPRARPVRHSRPTAAPAPERDSAPTRPPMES